jgi:hypothetical protein
LFYFKTKYFIAGSGGAGHQFGFDSAQAVTSYPLGRVGAVGSGNRIKGSPSWLFLFIELYL